MSIRTQNRTGRLAALGLAMLAVVAFVFAWGHLTGADAAAQVTDENLDFSIAIGGEDCDTSGGDAECTLEPGESFTLEVYLNSLPTEIVGYEGIDLYVTYTGVSSDDNPSATEWPDCEFEAAFIDAGAVRWGCAYGVGAEFSPYTGLVGTTDFVCTDEQSSGNTVSLVHGGSDTGLTSQLLYVEGEGVADIITVNCGEPPTPAPAQPTALPPTGALPADTSGGIDAALWAIVASLVALSVVSFGALRWRFARGR